MFRFVVIFFVLVFIDFPFVNLDVVVAADNFSSKTWSYCDCYLLLN